MELQLQHHTIEHKALFESSSRKEKEKDKELKYAPCLTPSHSQSPPPSPLYPNRLLKKAEVHLSSVQQSVEQLQRESESVSERAAAMVDQLAQIKHLSEEVTGDLEQQRQVLAQQEGMEEGVYRALQHRSEEERRLRAQCQSLFSLLRDLNKDVVAMVGSVLWVMTCNGDG